jgi:hypothetical protein
LEGSVVKRLFSTHPVAAGLAIAAGTLAGCLLAGTLAVVGMSPSVEPTRSTVVTGSVGAVVKHRGSRYADACADLDGTSRQACLTYADGVDEYTCSDLSTKRRVKLDALDTSGVLRAEVQAEITIDEMRMGDLNCQLPATTHATGQAVTTGDGARVSIFGVKLLRRTPWDDAETQFVALSLRTCAPTAAAPDGRPYAIDGNPWALLLRDGGVAEPVDGGNHSDASPHYPIGRLLDPGACTSGWLVFDVPTGARPAVAERQQQDPTTGRLLSDRWGLSWD